MSMRRKKQKNSLMSKAVLVALGKKGWDAYQRNKKQKTGMRRR